MVNYDRKITQGPLKNAEQLRKSYCYLEKRISDNGRMVRIMEEQLVSKKTFLYVDDKYIELVTGKYVMPLFGIIGGGGMLLWEFFSENKTMDEGWFAILVLIVLIIWTLISIIYIFTMPPKEEILDRLNGKITYTGFWWGKNITQSFDDAIFFFSTGGDDGAGSFELQLVRPNSMFAILGIGGDCYESLSLITWYMDKNRPLPPGTAFDPYRERDFERRKAEGFPFPLYPSNFETPEATEEQQKERERIGRW